MFLAAKGDSVTIDAFLTALSTTIETVVHVACNDNSNHPGLEGQKTRTAHCSAIAKRQQSNRNRARVKSF